MTEPGELPGHRLVLSPAIIILLKIIGSHMTNILWSKFEIFHISGQSHKYQPSPALPGTQQFVTR